MVFSVPFQYAFVHSFGQCILVLFLSLSSSILMLFAVPDFPGLYNVYIIFSIAGVPLYFQVDNLMATGALCLCSTIVGYVQKHSACLLVSVFVYTLCICYYHLPICRTFERSSVYLPRLMCISFAVFIRSCLFYFSLFSSFLPIRIRLALPPGRFVCCRHFLARLYSYFF